jgi:hypothetical protein
MLATSGRRVSPYIQERPNTLGPLMVLESSSMVCITAVRIFSLDGGPQSEDTRGYHSPGLRDGVSKQGTRVRPCHPKILGAVFAIARNILAGNKFDRSRVLIVAQFCGQTLFGCDLEKSEQEIFEFRGTRSSSNRPNPLLQSASNWNGNRPQEAQR